MSEHGSRRFTPPRNKGLKSGLELESGLQLFAPAGHGDRADHLYAYRQRKREWIDRSKTRETADQADRLSVQ